MCVFRLLYSNSMNMKGWVVENNLCGFKLTDNYWLEQGRAYSMEDLLSMTEGLLQTIELGRESDRIARNIRLKDNSRNLHWWCW